MLLTASYFRESNMSPVLTEAPLVTWTVSTTPALGAMISFSIFIASNIIRTWPSVTESPGFTLTSRMVPGMGASMFIAPAEELLPEQVQVLPEQVLRQALLPGQELELLPEQVLRQV